MMERRPEIVIADDHSTVAHALRVTLEKWFRVAAVVHSVERLREVLPGTMPRVVVLDIGFPEGSSLRDLAELVATYPATRFVMLTAHTDQVLLDAALGAGATGFVVKHSAPSELRVAIEEALEGRTYVTPLLRPPPTDATVIPPEFALPADAPQLNSRQLRILQLLTRGLTYREIADQMGVTPKTVEYHLNALRGRLGLAKAAQLVRWAREHLVDSTGEQVGGLDHQDVAASPFKESVKAVPRTEGPDGLAG